MSSLPSDGAPLVQEAAPVLTDAVELTVPDLGPSVESAAIVAWTKQVGEQVAADEPICRLAVNQLQFEVHSTAEGELLSLFAAPGDSVRRGDSLAEVALPAQPFYVNDPPGAIQEAEPEPVLPAEPEPVVEPELQPVVETAPDPEPPDPEPPAAAEPEPPAAAEPEPPAAAEPEPPESADASGPWPATDEGVDWGHWRSPVVRKLAEDHGIDLSEVEGTGLGGRIRKRDVLAYRQDSPALDA